MSPGFESWTTVTGWVRSLDSAGYQSVANRRSFAMPEAVIVSAARSPIGRAGKGSLVSIRPDDLAVQMVRAALDKVPALVGFDHLPGCTVTRYCASSLQSTRMAFHAIKAGEGDVFISAGVETVSRFAKGSSDSWPDTHNPLFAEAEHRTVATAESGTDSWTDPRESGDVPDVYIAMGQTAENLARLKNISREEMDEFGVRSQNLAEKA